jgi:sortase A
MRLTNWFYSVIFFIGLGFIGVALAPFVQAGWRSFWAAQTEAVAPVVIEDFLAKAEAGPKILGDLNSLTAAPRSPVIVESLIDYGNLENWFAGQAPRASSQTAVSYTLAIPKLEIANALVKVGGNNIDNNLVQFNVEPQIGGFGAPVIFGHSSLRQLYNPKETNKNRYKTIFSTIMTLTPGDEIKITVGDLTYTYLVKEKKEVAPDDDYILAQNPNLKQIKIVTCVPEGTYLRRGVITAELKL